MENLDKYLDLCQIGGERFKEVVEIAGPLSFGEN